MIWLSLPQRWLPFIWQCDADDVGNVPRLFAKMSWTVWGLGQWRPMLFWWPTDVGVGGDGDVLLPVDPVSPTEK